MSKKVLLAIQIFALVIMVAYIPLVLRPDLILTVSEPVVAGIMIVGIMVVIATLGVIFGAMYKAFQWAKLRIQKRRVAK